MQTVINGETFITKFFYAQIPDSYFRKVPRSLLDSDEEIVLRGEQRRKFNKARTTTVKVSKMVSGELEQVVEASVQSYPTDIYVKALGRKLAFLKALDNPILKPFAETFLDSFEEQCQRSQRYDVSNLLPLLCAFIYVRP